MYAFISGPMVWIAFACFFAGLAFQTMQFLRLSQKKELRALPGKPKAKKKKKGKKAVKKKKAWTLAALFAWADGLFVRQLESLRTSLLGHHVVMAGFTILFHILLFVVPIFLLAHNILLRDALGLSLPSLPEALTDALTFVFLLCAFFFLFRRLFVRQVRAISGPYDYLMWLITVLPFLTGFMAYHQWCDYDLILRVHIIAGELMLIVIPFTKLGHMLFFFFYRFLVGTEYSFGQGKRAW